METNKNNSTTSQTQGQAKTNTTPSSGTQSSSNQGSSSMSSSSNQNMQGRSNQKATTGKGGMKDIQGKLTQFGSTAATKFSNMTTKQKAMVGGAVLALGAGWVALSQKNKNKIKNQISSAASTAKDAMHNVNAKQQQNKSEQQQNRSGSSSSSSTNARVK